MAKVLSHYYPLNPFRFLDVSSTGFEDAVHFWTEAHKLGYRAAIALISELAYHLLVFCAVAWMVLWVVAEVIFLGTFAHACIDIFNLYLKQ